MGFEPMKRFWRLRALQARAFDHSAISPKISGCKNTFFFILSNTFSKKISYPEKRLGQSLFCVSLPNHILSNIYFK